jgi:hypothetical protein
VKWNDFLQIARVRAVEEADARDEAWDAATLRRITLGARDPVVRASELIAASRVPDLAGALEIPALPGWIVAGGALAAFVAGWCLAALGQEREINLLALPLIAILLWNAAMLLLSLLHRAGKAGGGIAPAWLGKCLDRFGAKTGAAVKSIPAIRARFRALAGPAMLRRAGFRFRGALHLGAALLAFGSVAGMYARGWSKEYRAVWESTLLDESGARTFFGVLFAPASKATGIAIPLAEIPGMRRGVEVSGGKPGDALPWIHLYAATLGLLVIAPRVFFALLEWARSRRVPVLELRSAGWRDYFAGVQASIQGDGATVGIIAHAMALDDASRERWRRLARTRWRDAGAVDCRVIAPGGEPDFLSAWTPAAPRILLVFNLAATPEAEVHRALAEGISARLHEANPAAVLALTLDETELEKRWSGFADAAAKLKARVASWRDVMRGLAADWI